MSKFKYIRIWWTTAKKSGAQKSYAKNIHRWRWSQILNHLLNKKSTIVISIKIFNKVSNEELIIAFASITKIKQNRDILHVILDYIGSTDVAPKDIILSLNYERFRVKRLCKLLNTIHLQRYL